MPFLVDTFICILLCADEYQEFHSMQIFDGVLFTKSVEFKVNKQFLGFDEFNAELY